MSRRRALLVALGLTAALCSALAPAQTPAPPSTPPSPPPAPPPVGEVKALGQERYQVGRIVVDKRTRSFTVPGRMHVLGKPLEYLATSPGGRKAYESLLELDASGTEVNLACILIGLERDPNVPSWKPLSEAGKVGQRVVLSLAWGTGGQRRKLTAAEALLSADATVSAEAIEWAYTGSFTSTDGSRLAADITGTLISFIKRDWSGVIEAVSDISLGPYGSVRGSTALPPEGSVVELIVEAGESLEVIVTRWGMLAVFAVLVLAAFGAGTVGWQPSAMRVLVAAVVALLAPLFWPGLGPTPARTALRITAWSAASAVLAAIAMRLLGPPTQPWARISETDAMLMLILLLTHTVAAALESGWRGAAADVSSAREFAGRSAALGLALLGALPLWLGPASELLSKREPWLIDTVIGISPLTHLAVASGNDLLRNEWFYQHANLAALPFSYPGPYELAWGYAAAASALGLFALMFHFARRSAAAHSPLTPEIKP